jgi:putative hydrolase
MFLPVDTHVHTVASGHAYSTIQEIVTAAKYKGLKMIAITDHGPEMPGGPHLYHFGNMRILPREIDGIEILRGVEANILDHNGTLDMPIEYLVKLDIVLAGMHYICYPGGTVEENTRAYLAVMENPLVDIIVHPGNPEYPIDCEKFVQSAINKGIAIEINNSSLLGSRRGSIENCNNIAKTIAILGASIVLGSDAHIAMDVGKLGEAYAMIKEAGIKDEQIINRTVKNLKEYLRSRRPERRESFNI